MSARLTPLPLVQDAVIDRAWEIYRAARRATRTDIDARTGRWFDDDLWARCVAQAKGGR